MQLQILDDVVNYVNAKGQKKGTVPSLILINDEILRSLLTQLYSAEFDLDNISIIKLYTNIDTLIESYDKNKIKHDSEIEKFLKLTFITFRNNHIIIIFLSTINNNKCF